MPRSKIWTLIAVLCSGARMARSDFQKQKETELYAGLQEHHVIPRYRASASAPHRTLQSGTWPSGRLGRWQQAVCASLSFLTKFFPGKHASAHTQGCETRQGRPAGCHAHPCTSLWHHLLRLRATGLCQTLPHTSMVLQRCCTYRVTP